MSEQARVLLEDGTEFFGRYFTEVRDSFGEIVFNTSMSGYQEVLTDPSYENQCVVMTYPLIGNVGINNADMESDRIYLNALLCKEYVDTPSNWQSVQTLKSYLNHHQRIGVQGLDTRAITLHIRSHGAQRVLITSDINTPTNELVQKINLQPAMSGANLAKKVSVSEPYEWAGGSSDVKYKVAVLDCGVKHNILRHLAQRGCRCDILPLDKAAELLANTTYDGLFISNGPGDPEPVNDAIEIIKHYLGKLPIFGICLGHQLIALALGGQTYKLKFGHHGINHPVKHLATGKVEITSQNHGFCVDLNSLPDVTETHVNLYDNTNEGFRHNHHPLFSVQYHPESAPGPCDSAYLFDEFVQLMETTHVHA